MFPITFTTKFTGLFYSNGKGGALMTTGVHVCARKKDGDGQEIVDLTGLTSRGQLSKSDIQLSPEAMDQLCAEWIEQRGAEFTAGLAIQKTYGDKRILVAVNNGEDGIDISEMDGMNHNILAYVDPYYLVGGDTGGDKDGFLQVCIYDPSETDEGPVACAVYTDEGVKIHVGDGGDTDRVEEFDQRQGIVSRRITDQYRVSKGE